MVTQQNETGLTYHRQSVPHRHLQANYSEYIVDITYDVSEATKEQLSEYQIVSFLRIVDTQFRTEQIIQNCKDAGCKVVIDIDDYWNLNPTHELYKAYSDNKIPEQTIAGLKNADWVTTTTEHFADKIREYNTNVTILPNSIYDFEPQFNPEPTYSDRVRFGYIAGVFHVPDAKLMYEGMKEVHKKIKKDKYQFCLGGFSNNESYKFIEFMFSDQYKALTNDYREYLAKYSEEDNHIGDSQNYKRLWGKDVFNYARLYNDIDVALVPLVENSFNSCKSQIKIIEAGWFKKPVIASNVMPYTIDCNKKNSILISPGKNKDWGIAIKSLILNPNKADDLAEALHQHVKANYNMDKVNVVRNELYKRICE